MKYFKTLLFCLIVNSVIAQAGFNYQGLLLDLNGNGISDRKGEFILNISEKEDGTNKYFSERHVLKTDENGIFNFVIGDGEALIGSLSNVDWLSSIPYINVQYDINDGKGSKSLGYSKFNSVPFCFKSKFIVCQKGLDGIDGAIGPQGPEGARGNIGPQGATNIQGASGPQGLPGLPVLPLLSIAPENPQLNEVYMDDGTNTADSQKGFRFFDGTNWIDL